MAYLRHLFFLLLFSFFSSLVSLDRDEYPPAMFKEGGKDASVRYISPRDNRGSGKCISIQCRSFSDGEKIKIIIGD